ncbi:alpha/beta fold hydrolase [Microbacterium sp. ZW T5_56]|uniref:alpha/beta fold hydrolase n=1 Tax=Microbacterium sp. ZW T5_56 TaxID=3378081 RepID=UPI0038541F2C
MTTTTTAPTVLLIAGHWLGAWAWHDVQEHLEAENTIAITLPGLDADDPRRAEATLDDQAAAIREVIAQCGDHPVVLVAHSGANGPVSLVLDRHPELVSRMVWVDSGPLTDGSAFDPDLAADVDELPLPSFDVLGAQASLDGLSADVLDRFRARAVPEPAPVVRQRVELVNEARRDVRTTAVCCSLSSAQLMELARAGHPMFAEMATLRHLELIDLPTGHWPMWSRPAELAQIIRTMTLPAE